MFHCYAHGWSHIEKPCPLCNPPRIYTSTSASILPDVYDRINELKMELCNLHGKYLTAINTLKEISNEDFRGNRPAGAVKAYDTLSKLGETT